MTRARNTSNELEQDLPTAPTGKIVITKKPPKVKKKETSFADLQKRLDKLKQSSSKGSKKSCTSLGLKLAKLINESNKLGKKAQEIEKQIDALALKIEKEGDTKCK